jgi:hypothetical protein
MRRHPEQAPAQAPERCLGCRKRTGSECAERDRLVGRRMPAEDGDHCGLVVKTNDRFIV